MHDQIAKNKDLIPEVMEIMSFGVPSGSVDLIIPKGVHYPPPSSLELACLLDVKPGESVLELGCGSGLIAITAAFLGARRVVATDISPLALESAARNALLNGLEDIISFYEGGWYEALPEYDRGPFETIIAIPPQTPGPSTFGPRYGGMNGTDHLFSVIDGAPDHIEPGRGILLILAVSLADPGSVMTRLKERFLDVNVIKETKRYFYPEDYNSLQRGLFDYLLALRRDGKAQFTEGGEGKWFFRNFFIRARGVRGK